jgi:hypothetical protein
MPNTLLHFGPNSYVALLLYKFLDFPVFILINIFINFESYLVILFHLNYPQHGYIHTFLISPFVAILVAILLYSLKNKLKKLMNFLRLPYETSFRKMLISSIFGAWLHIFLDAFVYSDIRPFFPLKANPLYGVISLFVMNLICIILFIPAFVLYIRNRRRFLS